MCVISLSPHKVLASLTPSDCVIKPDIPEQLEFSPGPGQGQDLTCTDWPGLVFLSLPLIL